MQQVSFDKLEWSATIKIAGIRTKETWPTFKSQTAHYNLIEFAILPLFVEFQGLSVLHSYSRTSLFVIYRANSCIWIH